MDFPNIKIADVKRGGFLIVRYIPILPDSNEMVAAKIVGVGENGIQYRNKSAGIDGVLGGKDYLEMARTMGLAINALLVGLPENFQPPLDVKYVNKVGGVYVPATQKELLKRLSKREFYQKSLETLDFPNVGRKNGFLGFEDLS